MHAALQLLWPRSCAGCDAPCPTRLCPSCASEVGLREIRAGDEAGLPVRGHALAGYDSGLGRALQRAKYGADRELMQLLAGLLADAAAPLVAGSDVVVPAPSPWDRRMRRGFAPAAVLAEAVATAAGLPVVHALAIRRGVRQAGLDARGRRSNLRGRLRSVAPAPGRVVLVDDVVTTGTTLGLCASELLGDETERASVLVLCAATLSRPSEPVRILKQVSEIRDTKR